MAGLKGVHPRLVTPPPDPRPSLAMLPPLKGLGDDFAWALWYSVWKAHAAGGNASLRAAEGAATRDRFRAAAASVPELRDDLEVLARFAGGQEEPRATADALMRVGEWAAANAFAEPAIQCTEASAALAPGSARRALAAGRMNRLFGEVARAELFYERAIALARRTRNWRVYVRAHLGKGQVKKTLGNPAAARAHYSTAARAAQSLSGEKWLAAQTQHDLLGLAAEAGAFGEAITHARKALAWYPLHHPSFPGLVHDFGFLLVRLRVFEPAIELLEFACESMPPQDQVIGWSTLARAAAGAGNAALYKAASDHVLRRVGLFDLHAAAAFDNLAWGACFLAQWDDAAQYASRNLEISRQKRELDAAANSRQALVLANAREIPPRDPPSDERLLAMLDSIISDTIPRMAAWRGSTWKRKHQSGREQLGRI